MLSTTLPRRDEPKRNDRKYTLGQLWYPRAGSRRHASDSHAAASAHRARKMRDADELGQLAGRPTDVARDGRIQ